MVSAAPRTRGKTKATERRDRGRKKETVKDKVLKILNQEILSQNVGVLLLVLVLILALIVLLSMRFMEKMELTGMKTCKQLVFRIMYVHSQNTMLIKQYWVNTGKNEILEDVLKVATDDITERLYSLLQGERVIARIDQNVVYSSLAEDPANIYSLLLVAGYLKTPKKELQADGSYLCEVSIPNREIAAVYKSEILSHLLKIGAITRTTANKIAESLYANDYKKLQKAITEYMDKSISFYDTGAEGFYHGLVLGLIALMDNQYKIKSNRESGDGRYDISLIPSTAFKN